MEFDRLPSTVMPASAVTLTFDFLTRKPIQYVSRPRYVCDLSFVKLAPIVTNIIAFTLHSLHMVKTIQDRRAFI